MTSAISAYAGMDPEQLRSGGNEKEKLRKVATEFESLLLTQMLKTMRESGAGGWLGSGDDQAGTVMVEMAEQQFARVMAAQGGLGLSELAVAGLAKGEGNDPTTGKSGE